MTRLLLAVALAATSSAAAAQTVKVTLSEFKLTLSADTVAAGPITFNVSNTGTMNHALYVKGSGANKGTADIGPGSAATLKLTLKPGTYDVYCPVSDGSHRMAGMEHKLVVRDAAPPPKKKP
jgi:uncharacterized cupredoxin-like copper-binding protein